jgi:hypothetical protein
MDCFASLAMTVLGLPSLKMNQKLIFDGAELRFRRLRPKASAPQSNPPLHAAVHLPGAKAST